MHHAPVSAGHVASVYQVCWSADSRYVASASKDSTVKVWRANFGECTQPVTLFCAVASQTCSHLARLDALDACIRCRAAAS